MTPKEKAKELYFKYLNLPNYIQVEFETGYREDDFGVSCQYAKQAALIAVDEILSNFGLRAEGMTHFTTYSAIQYYQKVKQELELL